MEREDLHQKQQENDPAHEQETNVEANAEPTPTPETGSVSEGATLDVSELLAKLDQATAEFAEMRDRALRTQADFDNFRKRVNREKDELRKYACAGLVESLLPVLDNLALGLASAEIHHPEAASVIDGIKMVQTQFENVLRDAGVEKINPLGEVFDPNLHESVGQVANSEIPEGHVATVQRVGYALNGRLIRAAMVQISSGPEGTGE